MTTNDKKCRTRHPASQRIIAIMVSVMSLAAGDACAEVAVTDAWVRASVNAMRTTTAFMTLSAPQDATLVAARTPIARSIDILETRSVAGLEVGWPRGKIQIPAGGSVRLEPGGLHLQLLDTDTLLEEGNKVSLILSFELPSGRSEITIVAPVRNHNK